MADKPRIPIEETLRREREWREKRPPPQEEQAAAEAAVAEINAVTEAEKDRTETAVRKLEELVNSTGLRVASRNDNPIPSGPFALRPLNIVDQHSIPHRQWLYGTHLIRGYVTLLVAPGGTGKSTLILGMALALASNRNLLKTHIHQQCRVAVLNLEDPQDEIDRRLAALAIHYRITNEEIDGRLFISPPERAVSIARIDEDGFTVVYPDEEAIIKEIRNNQIDVVKVDPFVESHSLEENSNPQMVKAAAAWRRVARAGNCAVMLSHHVRKGPVSDIDAARGAKALSDSARIGLLLATMTEDEAKELSIDADQRLQYVRLDDAKANLSRRAGKARWFRLSDVTLDNATAPYDTGDEVGVIEAWEPPNVWEHITVPEINCLLDKIAAGLPGGDLYTDSRRYPATRWAGNLLMDINGYSPDQADKVVKTWVNNGLLKRTKYRNSDYKERDGLTVVDAKRPGDAHE